MTGSASIHAHVGTDDNYLALQGGGEGALPDWQSHRLGVKHLGFVVSDLTPWCADSRKGFPRRPWRAPTTAPPPRNFSPDDPGQAEFIQYRSEAPEQRH